MVKQTTRERLRGRNPRFLAQVALQVLHGDLKLDEIPKEDAAAFKNGFLRWAVEDEPGRRREWGAIGRVEGLPEQEKFPDLAPLLKDRDRYVETLWRRIKTDDEHADLRELYSQLGAETPYQRSLVDWFVRRFDLAAALKTSEARWSSPWLFAVLPVLALGLTIWVLSADPRWCWTVVAGLVGLAGMVGLTGYAARWNLGTTTQILLPRMAVGITIGYLFLAAAPHLVEVIGSRRGWVPLAFAALLFLVTFGYTVFHIWRRVHPDLNPSRLAQRALHVLAIGGAYTAFELLLFLPMFSSVHFFDAPAPEFDWTNLLLLASVALALGMVLELAWEEKPLTEPL